mmetsp:Transcript_9692/g.15565  ORF Transcript_9692/g.15565 Transcript_9692/m.15565 type:complete len:293 (-) Transcript_9692:366-1244(-)
MLSLDGECVEVPGVVEHVVEGELPVPLAHLVHEFLWRCHLHAVRTVLLLAKVVRGAPVQNELGRAGALRVYVPRVVVRGHGGGDRYAVGVGHVLQGMLHPTRVDHVLVVGGGPEVGCCRPCRGLQAWRGFPVKGIARVNCGVARAPPTQQLFVRQQELLRDVWTTGVESRVQPPVDRNLQKLDRILAHELHDLRAEVVCEEVGARSSRPVAFFRGGSGGGGGNCGRPHATICISFTRTHDRGDSGGGVGVGGVGVGKVGQGFGRDGFERGALDRVHHRRGCVAEAVQREVAI